MDNMIFSSSSSCSAWAPGSVPGGNSVLLRCSFGHRPLVRKKWLIENTILYQQQLFRSPLTNKTLLYLLHTCNDNKSVSCFLAELCLVVKQAFSIWYDTVLCSKEECRCCLILVRDKLSGSHRQLKKYCSHQVSQQGSLCPEAKALPTELPSLCSHVGIVSSAQRMLHWLFFNNHIVNASEHIIAR